MPIQTDPDGTLDIENATLRSRGIVALTNMVAGNDVVRSGGPALEVYGDPGPRLELVSNTAATDGTATFTRLESNVGVFSIQSGTDGATNGPITFGGFANERMRIDADGNVGIGTTDPPSYLTVASTINALDASDSATFDKYTAVITNTMASDADDKEMGISFASFTGTTFPSDARTPGAAITHERVDQWSKGKLHFKTKGNTNFNGACTTRMTIDESGNVGIGITNPLVDLEIENVNGSPELRFTDPFSGSTAAWDARSNVLGEISWYSRDNQFTDSYGKVASITSKHFDDGWPDGALCFTTSSNGVLNEDAMVIDQHGNVGIGKTNPDYALDVVGDILASGNITAYSDRRLKSNIRRIESALDKVCALNGYTFMMNEKSSTGLIAQEILPILPEAVTGSEETNYAVAYGNMMGLIVEAIKELKQKIG